jgi:protein-L-isoaspartate(D-aspartate) O-methyltransferase
MALAPAPQDGEAESRMAFVMALRRRGLRDTAILRAFESVPRRRFVPHRLMDLAQDDIALPIPCGQTMAAPSIQAELVRVLDIPPCGRVLEIGTGSGYGTSILARLAGEVVSVERFRSLAIEARARIAGLGIQNVRVHHFDGRHGFPEGAPYDRILVEASFEEPPPALLGQLGAGGRLVGVCRDADNSQLVRCARGPHRELIIEEFGPLIMPPLMRGIAEAL